MVPDLDHDLPQLAWNDLFFPASRRVRHDQEFFRQLLAELFVHPTDEFNRSGRLRGRAGVNLPLNVYVRPCFELEIALLGLSAVIASQGAINIDRVGMVPFDE